VTDIRHQPGHPAPKRRVGWCPIPREDIGNPNCLLMHRWTLLNTRLLKLYVHHFLPRAHDIDHHDHPRGFATFCWWGSYADVTLDGTTDVLRPGSFRLRPAHHAHITVVGPFGCWTTVAMGPKRRPWGFWRDGKWWPWKEYELRFGMAMRCDTDDQQGSATATTADVSPEEAAAARLAGKALGAYRREDTDRAALILNELLELYGHRGLYVAMLCWADYVADAAGPGNARGITVFDSTKNRRVPIDDAPPWAAWAARFINARAVGDFDQCYGLLESCANDDVLTACFNGLLHVVATTLDGYAEGKPRRAPLS
jgi:hypothetical protein